MKLKKPHCNFCDRDLTSVRVDGASIGESELVDITFDVAIDKVGAHANPTSLCADKFSHTSNPLRYAALVESWVEETAEEVRCSLCTKAVKLVRIVPKPVPTGAGGAAINPLQQLLQQVSGQPSGPFAMGSSSPNFGQNQATIVALLDSKFTDQELIDILTDIDALPGSTQRSDLLDALMQSLYG